MQYVGLLCVSTTNVHQTYLQKCYLCNTFIAKMKKK